MVIKQCDICEQKIDRDVVHISYRYNFGGVELCVSCAEPIKKFLKKHHLLQKTGWENASSATQAI